MSTLPTPQSDFNEILGLITAAKQRAVQVVNTTLIDLYWQVGEVISRKIAGAEWGDGVVAQLAEHIARTQPACVDLPAPICSACASFMRLTGAMKKSRHC